MGVLTPTGAGNPGLLVGISHHAVVCIRAPITGQIIVGAVIVVSLVADQERLGISRQGGDHGTDGQACQSADYRGTCRRDRSAAVIAPAAITANVIGLGDIDIVVPGIVITIVPGGRLWYLHGRYDRTPF